MALKDYWLFSKSNTIIQWGIIIIVLISVIYLVALSVIVQDLKYPRENPYLFILETLLFSIGCGSIVFLMAYGRNDLGLSTVLEFIIISLKFGILSILLQFSGFYSYAFGYKTS
jgi:uncharacterized SAM-binding protein YcdF (DUF218 family)